MENDAKRELKKNETIEKLRSLLFLGTYAAAIMMNLIMMLTVIATLLTVIATSDNSFTLAVTATYFSYVVQNFSRLLECRTQIMPFDRRTWWVIFCCGFLMGLIPLINMVLEQELAKFECIWRDIVLENLEEEEEEVEMVEETLDISLELELNIKEQMVTEKKIDFLEDHKTTTKEDQKLGRFCNTQCVGKENMLIRKIEKTTARMRQLEAALEEKCDELTAMTALEAENIHLRTEFNILKLQLRLGLKMSEQNVDIPLKPRMKIEKKIATEEKIDYTEDHIMNNRRYLE